MPRGYIPTFHVRYFGRRWYVIDNHGVVLSIHDDQVEGLKALQWTRWFAELREAERVHVDG